MDIKICGTCKHCENNTNRFGYCVKNDTFVDYQDTNQLCYEEYESDKN